MNTVTDPSLAAPAPFDDSTRPTLRALEAHDAFVGRHIGPSAADQATMLAALGYPTRQALIDAIVPRAIRRPSDGDGAMALPDAVSEAEALEKLKTLADRNRVFRSFIGQGYHGTFTPGVILRNVLENPAWYTAYTPYQPEISQGRLEAIINFQTMVSDLTAMDIANASMLDEATAAAEAMTLCLRVGRVEVEALRRRRRRPSADARGRAHARRAARHRDRRRGAVLGGIARRVRRAAAIPRHVRPRDRPRRRRRRRACARRARRRRRRPARADAAEAARRMGRRRRRRLEPALRRADGLRRSARGLLRDARRVQAQHAGPARRRDGRRERRPRVPPRAADARAAHPSREGDVEHLHRAGPARRDGRHVRGLSRAGRARRDRAARASADDGARGRAACARPRRLQRGAGSTRSRSAATPRSSTRPRRRSG